MYQVPVIEGLSVAPAPRHLGPDQATVGVYGHEGNTVGFDDPLLGRHVLFLGGIGTGKTIGMTALVRSLRATSTPDDVFVFFDTKGDYHAAFHTEGDVTIATRGPEWAGRVTWNLFEELASVDPTTLPEAALELAATLLDDVGESAGDDNRIWSNMARDLLGALVIALVRAGKPYTNADIRAIADRWTAREMRALIQQHPDLRGVTQYIEKDDSNTTRSVLVFFQQAVRQVFSAGFQDRGDFSIRSFLKGKGARAVFLEYDLAAGTSLAPVYRTLLDLALKESLSRARAAGRVFVVLDEFSLLPRLTHLDAGLNFGRSLGLRFVVGTQNIGQVAHAYGPGLADSVLAGFSTVFAFRLYDQASRDFVRARYGENRKLVRYDSSLKTRGVGEELLTGSVIEDWDLTGLAVGQCIAALPDHAPVRFTFAPPQDRP